MDIRFGEATRVVSQALATAVGRRVRIVTLDDSVVTPLGVDPARRRMAIWSSLLFGAVAGSVVWWISSDGPERAAADGDVTVEYTATGNEVRDSLTQAMGQVFADTLQLVVIVLLAVVAVLVAASLAFFGIGAYLSAMKAGRPARRAIDTEAQVVPTARLAARVSRRVFSPRLIVLRVADALWQRAVQAVAEEILAYGSGPAEVARFTRALRHRLARR
jgi:hypothetical protein